MNTKNLLQYSIFEGFKEEEIQKFIEVIKTKHYKKNEAIIKENEIGDSIMLLLDGTVSITKALTIKMNKLQKREKEFIKLNADQHPFFGEISIFNNNERTATIKAETDCEIGILYNKDLVNMCQDDHEIGYKAMTNIAKKLIDDLLVTNEQVLKLTTAFSLILDKK